VHTSQRKERKGEKQVQKQLESFDTIMVKQEYVDIIEILKNPKILKYISSDEIQFLSKYSG
jgi:hypothetical protein